LLVGLTLYDAFSGGLNKTNIPLPLLVSVRVHWSKKMNETIQHDFTLACVRLAQEIITDDEGTESAGHTHKSKAKQEALQALLNLENQPHLSFDHITDILYQLHESSSAQSKAGQGIVALLLAWANRQDLPFGDAVEAAHTLYLMSPKGSQEKQQAIQVLLTQAQWPHVTMKQSIEAVLALCYASPLRSHERKQAVQLLLELAQRPHLSVEDALVFITLDSDNMMLIGSTPAWEKRELAIKKHMLISLAQRPDLTSKQAAQVSGSLATFSDLQVG